MSPPQGKTGDVCVWLVTFLFFLLILAGGALLVLYVTMPETDDSAWLPIVGMTLVSIPWTFWIFTCIYRAIFPWRNPAGDATSSPLEETTAESTGGERRVRFGVATVITRPKDGGAAVSSGDGKVEAAGASRMANDDASSSLCSHESEAPLALSVS